MNSLTIDAREKKGMWFAVMSGLLYGLLGYFGVSLMNAGFSVGNLAFWRFLVSFLFLAIIIIYKKQLRPLGNQALRAFLSGAIFYGAPSILFFVASRYIGTGQSMVIFFIYPAFVMILNWLFEGKPLRAHYFLSFALILFGLVWLVDMGQIEFDFIGIGLSLLSALSYAFYILLSKKITLSPLQSTLMVSLGCAFTSGCLALFDNTLIWPDKIEQWAHIVGLGILCSALPILLMLEAMKYISSDKASLLSVLEPVFTVIFGVLLLGEELNVSIVLGIIFTLMGALSVTIKWRAFFLKPWKSLD